MGIHKSRSLEEKACMEECVEKDLGAEQENSLGTKQKTHMG